jgi:hypothetical protein
MEMRPSWCGLHFPSYLQGNWVLLVEDMASAVIMDPYFPTVALLGTYLSREKADYLLKCGVKHVILALDADASDKALAMRKEWNMIEHVVLLKEDIKDMKLKQVEDLSLELYDISDSARKCG